MAKTIVVDGQTFISEEFLAETMTKCAIRYTSVEDYEVCEGEARIVSAYQELLREGELTGTMTKFKAKYVNERFIKRTLGV